MSNIQYSPESIITSDLSLLSGSTLLWKTIVGSHMWKMNHPESDIDYFNAIIAPSRFVLLGLSTKNRQNITNLIDNSYFELQSIIYQLQTGNVNYLWGIMSPLIEYQENHALDELRSILRQNPAKNCYFSINGFASNLLTQLKQTPLIDRDSRQFRKKLNIICRSLRFGITLLREGEFRFTPTKCSQIEEGEADLSTLQDAFKESSYPMKPDPRPFDAYLMKWRLWKLKLDNLI